MAGLLDVLHADLTSESEELFLILEHLDDAGWNTPTLCSPWTIKDQVSHLAWNDDATVRALLDPEAFLLTRPATLEGIQRMVDSVIVDYHHTEGPELLAWFRNARHTLLDAFAGRNPKDRMPWYGPEMSLASKLTARFMETWAHSYDITEALGLPKAQTNRARHVVFLGLQAIPNTFATHARAEPDRPVRIEAVAPNGEIMRFGNDEATDVVRGDLFDLALVVTQRRNVADTDLVAQGSVAAEWLSIAQAFAGPPGRGRAPTGPKPGPRTLPTQT